MNKIQSGALLIGLAVIVNVAGRLLMAVAQKNQPVELAGLMAFIMLSSVVVGFFGLFRLISGLTNKKK